MKYNCTEQTLPNPFPSGRTIAKRLFFLLFILILSGCSGKNHVKTTPEPAVKASRIHVIAESRGDRLDIDSYDAAELFRRAKAAFAAENYADSSRNYQKLITEFPESPLVLPAQFNLGLSRERLEQWSDAYESYVRFLQGEITVIDRKDAWFRQVNCLEHLEQWAEALAILDQLQALRPDLTASEEVEILSRRGAALIALERIGEGELALREAIRIQQHDPRITPTSSVRFYSLAEFKLAELIHDEMRQIALPADEKTLEATLEKKCRRLLDAQYAYTKVIRIGDAKYAAAAAYRIGALYHHLRIDMLSAPPPVDLTAEERQIYLEILAERTAVLLIKAAKQWERTLKLAERLQMENEWIADTREELAEITAILQKTAPPPQTQPAGNSANP